MKNLPKKGREQSKESVTGQKIAKVDRLKAQYGEKTVLQDVSFDLLQNEILVILGTSGCGKSTLLKHMIGLYPPAEGSVEIFGRNVHTISEKEESGFYQKIGVMFQYGALLNSMTVGENVAIPLEQHSRLRPNLIENIVRQKLDLVGLSHAYDLMPSEISGGMRKRAAIARAIALEPQLFFGDEPSAGLDPITAYHLDKLILDLKTRLKMTIVIVTHELASIRRIADRILFLDKGHVLFHGTIEDALQSGISMIQEFFSKDRQH